MRKLEVAEVAEPSLWEWLFGSLDVGSSKLCNA